jgi:hypothetical protein
MSVDIRTVTLPALWADDAITDIPTPPVANTTYRNTDLGSTELLAGWPYQKIVDSADFNQTLWLISNLVKSCEQYGIMPWCASTTYKQNGICLASNGIFYWAKKENTGVNPVNDSGMTNWGVFLDPGDNFVTETVLMSQIDLCEKLANKTQTLSSSSTTTQYPSAKAVYDNINNLQNSKQNNITGGASSITTNNLTANRALLSDGNGKVAVSAVTNTELGYLDGVTSNIQTQLNGKQASGSYMTLSGNQTAGGIKTFSGQIIRSATPGASDNSNQVPNTAWVNSRITSIMNSNANITQLFFAPSGLKAGDIQLSQPFTNFAKILFCFSNDYADNAIMLQLDSKSLDFIMSNTTLNKTPTFIANGGYWRFKNYANGSTTTLFKVQDETAVFFGIWGLEY